MNLIEIKNNFKGVFNIKEVIDYIDNITDIYEFTDKNISVIVYYNKQKDNIDFDFIRRVIKRGTAVIRTKPIKLILLLSSAKKILVDDKILTPYHANSGFTFIKRNEIFIFRKEEFPKVIIHELLHHDINIHSDDFKMENKELLMKHFNIHGKCKLILNETIIELWATIMHLKFISKEYKIDFKKLLDIELKYSLYKCYQLFEMQKKRPDKQWYDECNIYCYIIFKTILYYYHGKLLDVYTFPYDDTKITKFLIKNSKLKTIKTNPYFQLTPTVRIQRPSNSLCFMLLSDL
jgi:hypothetical protein